MAEASRSVSATSQDGQKVAASDADLVGTAPDIKSEYLADFVSRIKEVKGIVTLPMRWVVEGTLG
jgi:hypothetical protein